MHMHIRNVINLPTHMHTYVILAISSLHSRFGITIIHMLEETVEHVCCDTGFSINPPIQFWI